MPNPYLSSIADGIFEGLNQYRKIKSDEEAANFEKEKFQWQKDQANRDYGLRLDEQDRAKRLLKIQEDAAARNVELHGPAMDKAKEEAAAAAYANSPEQRDLVNRGKRASAAYTEQMTDTLRQRMRQDIANDDEEEAVVKLMTAMMVSNDPRSGELTEKLSSGLGLNPMEQFEAEQRLNAPELVARKGKKLTGLNILKSPDIQKQAGISIEGDKVKLPNGKTIPAKDISFTVSDIPVLRKVRDKETGKEAYLLEQELVSDSFPFITFKHTGPATSNRSSDDGDKIVLRTPEESAAITKKRFDNLGEWQQIGMMASENGIDPAMLARYLVKNPEFMKTFNKQGKPEPIPRIMTEAQILARASEKMSIAEQSGAPISREEAIAAVKEEQALVQGKQTPPAATNKLKHQFSISVEQ